MGFYVVRNFLVPMNYILTKELRKNFLWENQRVESCAHYKLESGPDLLGEFFYSRKASIVKIEKDIWEIKYKKNVLGKRDITLIRKGTEETTASYCLRNWTIFRPYRYTLIIDDKIFRFKKEKTSLREMTDRHYLLSNGSEFVSYKAKLNFPAISLGNIAPELPFVGVVETNTTSILIILAGLYLLEMSFEDESVN
jgi:hypothetical protein